MFDPHPPTHDAWAHLAPMRAVVERLDSLATKDVVVTLIGEAGTGKDGLARRLHARSHRAHGPFVIVSCAAHPDGAAAAELFGRELPNGAPPIPGRLELADRGTLVLDELAELHPPLQERLLRFLEVGRFTRVDGSVRVSCDVRILCTGRRPLDEEVAAGRLRADLYYRVQGIALRVPPLRERPAEIASLMDYFAEERARFHAVAAPRFSREVRAALLRHSWPGNIRELRNVVEALCLLHGGRTVRLSDLPPHIGCQSGDRATITLPLDRPLAELHTRILHAVLDAEGGHQRRAADRLGISTRTLQRHLHAHVADEDPDQG